jgi:hypothetical protein
MIRDVNEIDLPRVEAFLQKHIATSLFLLSNLAESGYRLTEDLNSGNFSLLCCSVTGTNGTAKGFDEFINC